MPVLRFCVAKANTVIGAPARFRPSVGAHGMHPYGPIWCAAFEGIMQRGDLRPREGRGLSPAKNFSMTAIPKTR